MDSLFKDRIGGYSMFHFGKNNSLPTVIYFLFFLSLLYVGCILKPRQNTHPAANVHDSLNNGFFDYVNGAINYVWGVWFVSSQHDASRNEIDTRLAPRLASLFANLKRILHRARLQHTHAYT